MSAFVDRTSFVLMERVGVTQAATFNPDFAAYRLGSSKRAFQILSEGHGQTFLALKQALLERRPVRRSHDGERQTVCSYILGHAAGEERAFALLVEASSNMKRRVQANWTCLRLSKIEHVRFADERWVEQDYPGPVQRCVDQVHIDAKRSTDRRMSLG